ncbi:MAG: polyprenyl diphosphate synthase [Gammaproteobacteria bacterium]
MLSATNNSSVLPRHVTIIMDGNGRWAKQNGHPRHSGHRAGVRATRAIVEACAQKGVEALTLFAFSSENWNRPNDEVSNLMSLFLEVLQREVDVLHKNDISVRFIGAREELPARLQSRLANAEEQTKENKKMRLVLAVAYGGRWDIVQATRQVVDAVDAGTLQREDINEQVFSGYLSLADMPPPDLLIRTGGERRISNFLLWDLAYTELYFTDTLWPEFGANDLDAALDFFVRRQRRFGKTSEQVEAVGG